MPSCKAWWPSWNAPCPPKSASCNSAARWNRSGVPHGPHPTFSGGWLNLHAALILLAYGGLGLSGVAGAMYLTQEHNLKFHKLRAVFSLMPPIQRLELLMGRLLLAAFLLLSAGLLIGMGALKASQGVYFKSDLKIVWSLLVWLTCLTLLVSRWRFAQRGRRLAWATILPSNLHLLPPSRIRRIQRQSHD